jgi:hypothetical protein
VQQVGVIMLGATGWCYNVRCMFIHVKSFIEGGIIDIIGATIFRAAMLGVGVLDTIRYVGFSN